MKFNPIVCIMLICGILSLPFCKKDDTTTPTTTTNVVPAVNFTDYTGSYTYTDATGAVITDVAAKATIKDLGSNKLQITFSKSGSPTLSYTMKKEGDTYVNVDFSASVAAITFDDKSLDISVTSSNPVYVLVFSGTR
jgi:hypothetical protein